MTKLANHFINVVIFIFSEYSNNIYVKYSGRYYYFCIATQEIKQRVCWNLIDEVENETLKNNLDKSLLKEKLKFYNNPDNDKIQKLQNEIDRGMFLFK